MKNKMHFCDEDTPWGNVNRVGDVLEFLIYTTCLQTPNSNLPAPSNEVWSGLTLILTACSNTLEFAEKESK